MSQNHPPILTTEHQAEYGLLGQITLNRPTVLNVLNHQMIKTLTQTLTQWSKNPAIKAVCITGEGRGFCAGGDLKALYHSGLEQAAHSMAFFQDEYALNQLIHHYPKPYIALLQGITMGGGVGLSIPGKYRIAGDNLRLAMPETSIGLFPDVGALYFLSRLPNSAGLYYALTGEAMNANAANHFGLVDYVIPQHTLPTTIESLLALPELNQSTLTHYFDSIALETTNKTDNWGFLDGYPDFNTMFDALKINQHSAAKNIIKCLEKKSPFSLSVTYAAYTAAKHTSFTETLLQDLVNVKKCLSHPDLYEGIRALLIDKCNHPNWLKEENHSEQAHRPNRNEEKR